MKNIIPNLLKLAVIAAISIGIFFLVSPEKELHDELLAGSLNFLGNKLLAMVPNAEGEQVQEQFKVLEEEAMQGKVDAKELQHFAVTVLNAEAEGKKLPAREIDSMMVAARMRKTARKDMERLRRLAAQLQEYEKFQARFKEIAPLAEAFADSTTLLPVYRLSPQFSIQIDTIRFSIGQRALHAELAPPDPTKRTVVRPPIHFPEKAQALKEMAMDLNELKIELGRIQLDMRLSDSLRVKLRK